MEKTPNPRVSRKEPDEVSLKKPMFHAGKGADRAVVAGYTDVHVVPVGIKGWKDSGKKTSAVN